MRRFGYVENLADAPPPWRMEEAWPVISLRVSKDNQSSRVRTLIVAGTRRLVWAYKPKNSMEKSTLILTNEGKRMGLPILSEGTFHWSRLSCKEVERINRLLGVSWYGADLHRVMLGLSRTLVWTAEIRIETPNNSIARRDTHVQERSVTRSVTSYVMGSSDDGADGRDGFCAGGAYDAGW